MTEEEFFISNYPDSCYGDKPLSPHWDFFQDGVEFAKQQSEKKIEELEAQLEREKKEEMEEVASALAYQRTVGVDNRIAELEEKLANADYQLEGRDLEIKELEAQIEKMKCCGNCKNFNNFQEHCELDATQSVECHCNNYKLWEIKENA